MNILHLSTNDFGGAGSAALRIHRAHLHGGDNSLMLVRRSKNRSNTVVEVGSHRLYCLIRFLRVVLRKLIFREKYLMYGAIPNHPSDIVGILKGLDFVPDVVFVHWVSDFIDIVEIGKIKKEYGSKIIFYFMDMANFTGGCHFAYKCDGYKNSCCSCPADRLRLRYGLPYFNLKNKKIYVNSNSVISMAPNVYVARQVFVSTVFSSQAVVNYIPIPENIFCPSCSSFVSASKIRILFGSPDLTGGRKGGDLFLRMLCCFSSLALSSDCPRTVDVIVPGLEKGFSINYHNVSIRSVCYAQTEPELAQLYKDVDVFVCCSREDSGPMMISEALMSGVPVLTFDVGIASEIVIHGENGFIVDIGDIGSMASILLRLCQYTEKDFEALRLGARRMALERMSNKAFVYNVYKALN